MAVFATMGHRKPRRIAESVGCAMHDLGDLGQRADGPCADAGHEQKLGEILRTAFGGGRQIAVQTSGDDVLGPDIVMVGHDEMRQQGLSLRSRTFDAVSRQPGKLPFDPIWSELAEMPSCRRREASARRSVRLMITPCSTPSIAACGSSTKLCRPSESQ
jgi:hypothetical protein